MRRLRNLTLHEQGELECALAAERGLALCREPEGVMVGAGDGGLARAAAELAAKLGECAEAGEAALMGGHTGAAVAAVLRRWSEGRLPEIYCFEIERRRDEKGRFVYVPEGLVLITGERDAAGPEREGR